jgi:hypothetical protein
MSEETFIRVYSYNGGGREALNKFISDNEREAKAALCGEVEHFVHFMGGGLIEFTWALK